MARRRSTARLRPLPSYRLTVTQRLRNSWVSWSLSRTAKRTARATSRLVLLQQETDHQLLLLKELEQETRRLQHRQQEMTASAEWHSAGQVIPAEVKAEPALTPVQMLLGPGPEPSTQQTSLPTGER